MDLDDDKLQTIEQAEVQAVQHDTYQNADSYRRTPVICDPTPEEQAQIDALHAPHLSRVSPTIEPLRGVSWPSNNLSINKLTKPSQEQDRQVQMEREVSDDTEADNQS